MNSTTGPCLTPDLKSLVTWARKQHLKSVKIGDIEFSFHDKAFSPRKETKPSDIMRKARAMADEMDDDKLLLWSAGSNPG